jgi:hypothetical protein
MLLIAWSALPAGLVTQAMARRIWPCRRLAACLAGCIMGVYAGFACNAILFHLGGIPVLCLAGAIIGPCASLHLFPLSAKPGL